jgi:hypothetical protein
MYVFHVNILRNTLELFKTMIYSNLSKTFKGLIVPEDSHDPMEALEDGRPGLVEAEGV